MCVRTYITYSVYLFNNKLIKGIYNSREIRNEIQILSSVNENVDSNENSCILIL